MMRLTLKCSLHFKCDFGLRTSIVIGIGHTENSQQFIYFSKNYVANNFESKQKIKTKLQTQMIQLKIFTSANEVVSLVSQ